MMLVENVIRTEQDRRHLRSYLTSILADGGKLGKTPGNQQCHATAYHTSAFSRYPCSCKYTYAGFGQKHVVRQYGLARCLLLS